VKASVSFVTSLVSFMSKHRHMLSFFWVTYIPAACRPSKKERERQRERKKKKERERERERERKREREKARERERERERKSERERGGRGGRESIRSLSYVALCVHRSLLCVASSPCARLEYLTVCTSRVLNSVFWSQCVLES